MARKLGGEHVTMRIAIPIAGVSVMLSVMLLVSSIAAQTTNIALQAGPFAPNSTGHVVFTISNGVLSGHINAQNLPSQGPHAFYVLWFVRTDTGDKAFLGPIIDQQAQSILFMTAADGTSSFIAPAYTTGPHAGSSISLGAQGSNFFVLIAENQIDTFTPHPVATPPASFALMATF